MMFVTFLLLSVLLQLSGGKSFFNFRHVLPWNWRENLEQKDIFNSIELRLVNKDWKPKGALPNKDGKYSGTVSEAYEIFRAEGNLYEYTPEPLHSAENLLTAQGYNKNQDSIFILHTISGGAENDFVKNMMMALAMRDYMKDYNVFAFHLPGLQHSMEKTIMKTIVGLKGNYELVGGSIGQFFNSAVKKGLIKLNQIHILGYCYSSQLAAYVGRYISSTNKGDKIRSITALDPFSIALSGVRNKVINKEDADFVFAYHTNSIAYGSLYRRATADFVFNNGWFQPGCYFTLNVQCSHRRAVTLFWYVILYPDIWVGRRCFNWLLFKSCLCNWNKKAPLPFPPVEGITGKYFINTKGSKPYGVGESGAYCIKILHRKKPQ